MKAFKPPHQESRTQVRLFFAIPAVRRSLAQAKWAWGKHPIFLEIFAAIINDRENEQFRLRIARPRATQFVTAHPGGG
jgi:hypothetical protein